MNICSGSLPSTLVEDTPQMSQERVLAMRSVLLMASAHLIGMHHDNEHVPVWGALLLTEASC